MEILYPKNSVRLETRDEVEDIVMDEIRPEKVIKIGRNLAKETQGSLVILIKEYREVFAWTADNVPRIP